MNQEKKIICVGRLVVKEGCGEEARSLFEKMIMLSKKEEGCLSYTLQQDIDNPRAFTFIDHFKDKAAFDFHCNQDYIIDYFDNKLLQITDDIRVEVYTEMNS